MSRNRKNAIRMKPVDIVFEVANYTLLMMLNIIMLYPILYTISVSISDPHAVEMGKIWLYPIGFSPKAYEKIISDSAFLNSYLNTVIYSASGTIVSVLLLSITAYPLSISTLKGRGKITLFFAITMFFGGGLIPTYLVIKGLGMLDTIWAIILPGAMSTWYIVLCRTFFQGISPSLRESAQIDGANEWIILFKIVMPLSKALLAVMALYVIVGQWNSYFGPFIYLNDMDKFPVQLILRRILVEGKSMNQGKNMTANAARLTTPETIRAAAIMVTITPIMCIYPFVQKYFVKGIMIGSIKG